MAIVDTPLAGKADAESLLLYRKITWKLIPFLCLCYLAAYLDRINVGLAKLQMADALQEILTEGETSSPANRTLTVRSA